MPAALGDFAFELKTFNDVGLIRPIRPDKLGRIAERYFRLASPALGAAANAISVPDRVAIIDEAGSLTWERTHRRSNALARALRDEGVEMGTGSRSCAATIATSSRRRWLAPSSARVALYLNTAFAGPQLADVLEREKPAALIYDQEFTDLLSGAAGSVRRFVGWEEKEGTDETTLEQLISRSHGEDLEPPSEHGRYIILTSGTTGTPKGAQRSEPEGLSSLAALFSKIPRRYGETAMIAAPLFHSWGFLHFMLSLPTAATMVLRPKFDPEDTLRATAEHRARVLAVVPVMMQRILALPDEVKRRYDLSALEVTAASGSALPGDLATTVDGRVRRQPLQPLRLDRGRLGDDRDARRTCGPRPARAGRPPRGTVIRIVDEDGNDVPPGETGRIFIGNQLAFEGYTGGGDKEHLGDLLSSGDVGHFDEEGRLFIDGRDDEMIVSGGENVFPREVEDLLADHDAVADAAAIGVDDEQFGQRLRAFVVKADGADTSEDELKDYVKANLARYKVPREIVFVDELPRNATGKVLKRELAERQPAD